MMIRILLLLLSALFLSQCAQYHIDLDQCDKTTKCFIRESCIEGLDSKTATLVQLTKHYQHTYDKLKNRNCDVVIQMRPFSYKKYHVMVQVNISDSAETIAKSGVSLKQGEVQFACMEGGPTVKDDVFNIVELGDQIYEDKLVFCSFTMELKVGKLIEEKFDKNDNKPTLEFTLGTATSIEYESSKWVFWHRGSLNACDPEKITSTESFAEPLLQEKIDIYAFPPLKCDQPKLFLTITRENAQLTALAKGESLTCESYQWTSVESLTPISIPVSEKFQVACTAKYCTLCAQLERLDCKYGCTPYVQSDESQGCMTATCPNNQWMINDGRMVKGEVVCAQEANTPYSKNAFWYLKNGTEFILEVTKAVCYDKGVCWARKQFTNGCPDDMECAKFNITSDLTEIYCEEGKQLMWDYVGKSGQPSKITCDFATGAFKDAENNKTMHVGCNVFCVEKDKPIAASTGHTGVIVGGALSGILFAVAGVVVLIMIRKRRVVDGVGNQAPNASCDGQSRLNSTEKRDGAHSAI